jgi:hypothetical protein
MDGKSPAPAPPRSPPPDGAEGGNSLDDAAEEAVREMEKRRDGSGGYSGEGDIG